MKIIYIKKLTLVAITPLLLQSCFVAKTYKRPAVDTEALFRTDNLPKDSVSMASLGYKDLFTDAYLQEYIAKGLENNLDIRIALQNMAAAEAYMKQGRAGYLPSIDASATFSRTARQSDNGQFGSFFPRPFEQYEVTGRLSWEADVWGKIRSTKRANDATYLQTVAAHQGVKTDLIAQIATNYYLLLALDEELRVVQKTIETRQESLKTIQLLKDAGTENQVGVDRSAALLYNAQAQILDIKEEIFKTENTLGLLLGEHAQGYPRGSLGNQQISAEIKTGVPLLLLRNRPDVMQAEFGLMNSFELTNVAKSNFYPSFTLTASAGFQSLEFDNWIDSGSILANIVGGLTQPIFNNRKIRTAFEVAKARQEQSLLSFKKTLLIAGNEVSNALYSYTIAVEKEAYITKEVGALRNAQANSRELLVNGYANYLDLLTATENALNSELAFIGNRLDQLTAKVTLYRALGGGWQ